MNLRPILYLTGLLLCVLAALMALPLFVALQSGGGNAEKFMSCMMFTSFFGGLLVLANRDNKDTLSYKQGFALIGVTAITLPLFAALPFLYSNLNLSFTDAMFESVAGITTTSSTVFTDLDATPRGILLWRALLQWAGGGGIVLLTLPLMSFIRIGGMQLFDKDMLENEKALPHTAQIVSSVAVAYGALTLINAIAYHLAGMPVFDAVAHAMSTVSSGGFSTRNEGLNLWGDDVKAIAIIFMTLSALPFILYIRSAHGSPKAVFQDSQVRFFLSVIIYATAVLALYLVFRHGIGPGKAVFESMFNVVSAVTGTGYQTAAGYIGGFAAALLLFLVFAGGCAGSTTSGIKTFRFQVLYSTANAQVQKLLYPNGVFIARYNQKSLPEGISIAVMAFFFLYALSFSLVMLGLSITGLGFMDSLSHAATSLANAGAVWDAGANQETSLQSLSAGAKWIMIAAMIVGRLEMFPILILLSPQFWRR